MKIKQGYAAEATEKKDLTYWLNLWAEAKDTWYETKDTAAQIWNLILQIVELITQLVPIVRMYCKKWIDFIRYKW